MKKLIAVILASTFLAACSGVGIGTGGSKLNVKVGGKDSTLDVKSTTADYNTFAVTGPDGKSTPVTLQSIHLANHEMDANPLSWNKSPTDPSQVRVIITLMNGDGPSEKFKVGTYNAQSETANGIYTYVIYTFADGKPIETRFRGTYMGGFKIDNKPTGEVKITKVTADTVSGEVDLTERDTSIKGTFTAKLPAPPK